MWGRRLVIPLKLQGHLLDELHECHPGMCRMKALARSFVWWPGIDQNIEDRVNFCEDCVSAQSTPKSVPLLFWPWATEPWQRIHVDFGLVFDLSNTKGKKPLKLWPEQSVKIH